MNRKRWIIVGAVVLGLVILAVVVAPFVYINVIKDDAPDALASTDSVVSAGDDVPADGTWVISGADNIVGYRVVEVLFGQDTEGVGRTDAVTGGMTIDGTQVTEASFSVDMTTVTSDETRRDNQFHGRLLSTGEFPTATFVLTTPIELGDIPADGVETAVQAVGDLTLRDTTQEVTLDLKVRKSGGTIQVVGSTDIVFADYGIPMPDVPGITTQDHGLLEFDLHFTPG